jgi:DNA-binding MarR family transcriptional regulator
MVLGLLRECRPDRADCRPGLTGRVIHAQWTGRGPEGAAPGSSYRRPSPSARPGPTSGPVATSVWVPRYELHLRANARFAICAFARINTMVANATARRLRDAVRHLVVAHGALEELTRPCGAKLSIPHAYALLELRDHGDPMTVSELAAKLAIDRTNVSRLCARMEEAGHLARAPHPEDGRARALRLTARGKKLARVVDDQSASHFGRLAKRLGGSLPEVVTTLDRLSNAMGLTEEDCT